ncbi:MAG: adenylate/guanylate cyclase domain-containing protein [Geminicoccaceae bacterium]
MAVTPGTVLVVDDHPTSRLKLSLAVRNLGHATIEAQNGVEALERLRSTAVDLVLLDILMPEMDGYQVLHAMKADPKLQSLPVIVISALDELESVIACIELGAEDYLPKTFDPLLLRARVNSSLEKKHLRDAVVKQMEFIREIFGKYVPDSVASALVESKGNLAPVRTAVSIVYSDLVGFTTLSETIQPEHTFRMLNEYFPAVIEPITRRGGVVSGFHGDGMLALFNVPLADPRHADHAVQAALEIAERTRSRTFAGLSLVTRIGVNTGEVLAGTVGSGNRLSYTVLGDPVNVAARLEEMNKSYGTSVLVSGSTFDALSEECRLAAMGQVAIRGKREPVRIYCHEAEVQAANQSRVA